MGGRVRRGEAAAAGDLQIGKKSKNIGCRERKKISVAYQASSVIQWVN